MRLFIPLTVLSCLFCFASNVALDVALAKESRAEKKERLEEERQNAALDKIDPDTLDFESGLALRKDREIRRLRKERAQFRKYDGINPRWNKSAVYTKDSELETPLVTAPFFGPWVAVDGRRVRGVYRKSVVAFLFQGALVQGKTFEGLEDDKGKVLLPCVYDEVHVVPGQGVLLLSHLNPNLFESYDVKSGARKPRPKLLKVEHNRSETAQTITRYIFVTALSETVELKSPDGAAQPPDSLQTVSTKSQASVQSLAQAPAAEKLPLARLEFWNEQGENYLTIEKAAPATVWGYNDNSKPQYFARAHWFKSAHPLTPNGDVAMLLFDKEWQPMGDYMPRALNSNGLMGLGALIPSPFQEGCWLRLANDGKSFGSPVGSLGYKPLGGGSAPMDEQFRRAYHSSRNEAPEEVFWVVAYPTPDGVGWKWLDPESLEPIGPMWKDIQQLDTPILNEGWSASDPLIAVQEMSGRWKVLRLPQKSRMGTIAEIGTSRLGLFRFSPLNWVNGPNAQDDYASLNHVVEYHEQRVLEAKSRRIAFEKWQKHYDEVEKPRIERQRRWSDAWQSGSWRTIEATATAMGSDYYVEFVERYPSASSDQLRRALSLVTSPEKKASFERRAQLADEKAAAAAAERARIIEEDRKRRLAQSNNARAFDTAPGWNNWNSYTDYAQQSAKNAQKLQAMNDYLYGRSNNPLLNPFR